MCSHFTSTCVSLICKHTCQFSSEAGSLRKTMPGCLFESHLWSWSCLARLGSHLVVNRAAESYSHPFLGHVRTILGHLGDVVGILGPSWGRDGSSCAHLGSFWSPLGGILAVYLGVLGPSWDRDGSSWAHLGPDCDMLEPTKRLRKGISRPTQGLQALTWSLLVARRPHAKTIKQPWNN